MNTLNYKCYYDSHYDFIGEKYSSLYPYLHKYPATMIPQIGIKLLNDYNISKDAKMLDPYCGSDSFLFVCLLNDRLIFKVRMQHMNLVFVFVFVF